MIRHILEWLFAFGFFQFGLTINGINFGTYNPIRKPEMGQQLGDVQVLRKTTHAHAMGSTRSILPIRHWLISPIAVAGNVAGSQAANEAMARWLEEMATNPDIQPMLVQWSNARALPQDGWWFLKSAKPDYQWTGGGALPVDMEWHFRAQKGAPLYIGYDGGAIPGSPATQPATNLIAYPPNSTAIITATRAGAEGAYPYVLSPAQKPVTLQGSSTVTDLFKGGCHVYDTMAAIATNPVPTGGGTGANLLTNPGFETQPPNDWLANNVGTGTSDATDTSTPHSGSRNLKLTNPSSGNYGGIFNRVGIPIAGVAQLNVAAWIKGSSGGVLSSLGGGIRITFANAGTSVSSAGIASAQPSAQASVAVVDFQPTITTSYAQYAETIAVPAGYTWAFIELYANGTGAIATTWIDDLAIVNAVFNTNWLEVFGLEHVFTGDLVVTNGLHLYVFSLAGAMLTAYVWNTALAPPTWNQVGSMDLLDGLSAVGALQGIRLRKIGFESVHLDCTMATATNAALVTVRLDRGQYNFRLYVRPDTFANTNAALLRWTPAQAGAGIVYNSGAVSDQTFGAGSLASTTDAQYGAAFIPSANTQWLYGFLHPKAEAQQPGFTSSALNLGDTAAPAQRSTVTYGFFIVPFPTTASLQANGFSGTLGTGWSSVADVNTRNGVSTAKCASGTLTGNDDMLNAAFIPPNAWPGVYDVWFRVRVTSAAGAAAEMTLGLWDSTLVNWIGTPTTFRANQANTSYVWLKATTSLTLATTNRPRLRALTAATLGTDWFVDEAVIVPKTLSVNNLGPQEQFQQWLFERTTQYPVA